VANNNIAETNNKLATCYNHSKFCNIKKITRFNFNRKSLCSYAYCHWPQWYEKWTKSHWQCLSIWEI